MTPKQHAPLLYCNLLKGWIVKPSILLLFFILNVSSYVFSQTTISGKITNIEGVGIPQVSVMEKGKKSGSITSDDGSFTLAVNNPNALLVASSVGFIAQEISLNGKTSLAVVLKSNDSKMEEVVVVGYGTQKKVTVTGAVAQVKGSELAKSPNLNLSNSLAGRLPGVTAINSSGEPGYDGSAIRIRGTNSLGNSDALIVIDGVPNREGGLQRLNPMDIESVSVLKDAAAAIYGSRAANGVILITTKRGKTGKPQLSYNFNQGWAQATRIPELCDVLEYGAIRNESQVFDGNIPVDQWEAALKALQTTGTYTTPTVPGSSPQTISSPAGFFPADIVKYKDGSDPWGHPNTDWFGDALKKWAPQERHNLQVNGGTETVRYIASIGYNNQDAYYKNSATGYKQYDMRLNIDAKVNKYLNVSLGITAREEYRFFPTESAGSIFRMLMRGKPQENEIWPNGLPGRDIENGQNPIVITTNATGYDKDKRDYFQTNGKVELLIPGVEGLKITGTAAVDKYQFNGKRWATPWYLYSWNGIDLEADGKTPKLQKELRSTFSDPRLNQNSENNLSINLSALLNYDRTIGDHAITFLAGVQRETLSDEYMNTFRRYYISTAIDQIFAGGDREKNNGGGAYDRARLSYFGRVGYNYKQKYIAEFLWRYDGSYIFPPSHRFGFFPGVTAGWRVSEENFFKNNIRFINNLKLRGSWGQMGAEAYINGNLAEYQFLGTYGFSSYILNDAAARALYETKVPNLNSTWEVGNSTNFGLEAAFLNNKLNIEFDFFMNTRAKALIRSGSVPQTSGISALLPPVNLGKVDNKGWEFKVGYGDQAGLFKYNVSVNGGYAKNKVVFFDEATGAPIYQRATGHPYGTNGFSFIAYQYDGVFRDQKEISANTIDYSGVGALTLRPGDMKFKDINGDKKIDGDDQVRSDKTRDPTFTGGLNLYLQYKGFDCTILFQGATGGLLYIGTQSGDWGNYLQYSFDNRWSIEKPSSVDPRLPNRNNTYYSAQAGNNTYWLRSSDYLRLKNVEIGYNISASLLKKAGIGNVRIYAGGVNLITWDEMKIWDPESTSGDGTYYPQSRIINIGASITF